MTISARTPHVVLAASVGSVCVLLASTLLIPAAAAEPDVPALTKDYRIGPADVLDISVWSYPELARVVPVRPDGRISFPLVNDIEVAGLTPMELREILTGRLTTYVPDPEVTVIVREVHSFKVSVIGQVRTPGRYELDTHATVLDVLALAEGFTEFAARSRILILRPEETTTQRIRFNYDAVTSNGKDEAVLAVRPGDIIVVP